MSGICEGRVVIVTGAGRGIGREHALEFARQGARVVVNDIGADLAGTGTSDAPAQEVVAEILAMGGEAVVDGNDVSDWDGAKALVSKAVDTFGDLHVLVNNAGILRDRMIANMSIDEWDAVIRVHMRGAFATSRHAIEYWRGQSKAGAQVDARIIHTSSASGIFGNVGQTNYGAAKAGIAAMTVISAMEVERYGITVNAIAPGALTRMTEVMGAYQQGSELPEGAFDPRDPSNIAPVVAWLGSPLSKDVTGRVFTVRGGRVTVALGWVNGPSADKGARWEPAELTDVIPGLVARARANSGMNGEPLDGSTA